MAYGWPPLGCPEEVGPKPMQWLARKSSFLVYLSVVKKEIWPFWFSLYLVAKTNVCLCFPSRN